MSPPANAKITWPRRLGATALTLALLGLGLASEPARAQVGPATADLNDDGVVNILDFSALAGRFGLQAGEAGYREGLDLVPNGVIGVDDFGAMAPNFGQAADTSPTTLRGRVFDGLGNPLPGVTVSLGANTIDAVTGPLGNYFFDDVSAMDLGENVITFDGSSVAASDDPTPGFLSGFYPTIPNKPIFVNGGTEIVFRGMSLPERDLNGAVDLSVAGTNLGGNSWLLNNDEEIKNAGVSLFIPAGCTATLPPGEDPVLSITRVDPAMLPVPMPPGLASSLFVTYQPGGTVIDCPAGVEVFTEFDNNDGFPNGPGDFIDGPFLAGITNGVFSSLTVCDVSGATEDMPGVFTGGTLTCGPVPLPFEFAWYHADILPPIPCPRTTVVGTVRLNDVLMFPVFGASVSVPGSGPVTTADDGSFRIPNVPAGPNGRFCFNRPFNLRAGASHDADTPADGVQADELGASAFVAAVPGGITDVGDIKLGSIGAVQGFVKALCSIDPFMSVVVPDALVDYRNIATGFGLEASTGPGGGFDFTPVPITNYSLTAAFSGELVKMDGTAFPVDFFGVKNGQIDPEGDLDVHKFHFVANGGVEVTVLDLDGVPIQDALVELTNAEEDRDLGQGFIAEVYHLLAFTDANGVAHFVEGNGNGNALNGHLPEPALGPGAAFAVAGFDGRNGDFPLADVYIEEFPDAVAVPFFVNDIRELVEIELRVPRDGISIPD